MAETLLISDIHSLKQNEALDILAQISRVERKTFPTAEVFDFNTQLWKKKPNTRVIYAIGASIVGSVAPSQPLALVAYAVYVRQKGVALLHKICVIEPLRGTGIGRKLIEYIRERLEKEGCHYIQLWVDDARKTALALYTRCGFQERESVPNYYAPGRTGIRMVLDLGHN